MSEPDLDIDRRVRAALARIDRKLAARISTLDPGAPLWNEVDSLRVMEILDSLEQEFGLTVEPEDVSTTKLDTLEHVAAFVRAQLARHT